MPPPIVLDDLAQRDAHRHLDQPGVARSCRPARRPWCPCDFAVPIAANHSPPLRMIGGDVGEGLDVVDQRRIAPQAATRPGYGGRGRGWPRSPSIDAISAVSSPQTNAPGAQPDLDVEGELRARRCSLPSKPERFACGWRSSAARPPAGIRRGRRRSPCSRRPRRRRSPCPRARGADRDSSTARSMNAPGSPSSALQMTYFCAPASWPPCDHFRPGRVAAAAAAAQAAGDDLAAPPPPGVISVSAVHQRRVAVGGDVVARCSRDR